MFPYPLPFNIHLILSSHLFCSYQEYIRKDREHIAPNINIFLVYKRQTVNKREWLTLNNLEADTWELFLCLCCKWKNGIVWNSHIKLWISLFILISVHFGQIGNLFPELCHLEVLKTQWDLCILYVGSKGFIAGSRGETSEQFSDTLWSLQES